MPFFTNNWVHIVTGLIVYVLVHLWFERPARRKQNEAYGQHLKESVQEVSAKIKRKESADESDHEEDEDEKVLIYFKYLIVRTL
jgi:hypothetical protein